MDTITHGIAGALIGKAVFRGQDIFPPFPVDKRRVLTWTLMLGAIFPDSDVLREFFSKNELLMITWHRSITHSLLCLPIWCLALAGITLVICRWRRWESPSYLILCLVWCVGILSHILLDLVTTYGTMIWSPLNWSRPAWDILFILDFSFTALLLIPQLLAWAYEDPEHFRRRALIMWLIFTPAPFLISRIALIVGAPTSNEAILAATLVFAALFLLPAVRGWGLRVPYLIWHRLGLTFSILYIITAGFLHHKALQRTEEFAKANQIEVQSLGALPLPPSFWHWDGLVRSSRGVYEVRMEISDSILPSSRQPLPATPDLIQHTYYPDAPANSFIDAARGLPEVQKVLWFSRFPVTRFHREGSEAIVEFLDMRFPQIPPNRPQSFDYRVRFTSEGKLKEQGWVK